MRQSFPWHFPFSDAERDSLWVNGFLTADTNVLLDLYRYHPGTRDKLLEAFQRFGERTHLSHQVAEEFFRNRKRVIIHARQTFEDLKFDINKLKNQSSEIANRLKKNRALDDSVGEEFKSEMESAFIHLENKIDAAKESFPDYLSNDPVLETISSIFEGRIGAPLTEKAKEEASNRAKERFEKSIPPGYEDAEKEGDQKYGDYFFWCQVLDFAETESTPVLLITSETKPDWWEVSSGKTLGPRSELLREFNLRTGHRILILRTESFLREASDRFELNVDDATVNEVRSVGFLREKPKEAVRTRQVDHNTGGRTAHGEVIIELVRPVYNFTGTGKFEPNLEESPHLMVDLISTPDICPSTQFKVGGVNERGFNVHLRSAMYGEYLPEGEYCFAYKADCDNSFDDTEA